MDGDADREFVRLASDYLDDRAERHPDLATGLGDHRFDAHLPDPSEAALVSERRALDGWAARLSALDSGALAAEHRADAAMMADSVARRVFEIEELAEHTWNPLLANPGKAIYQLLARDFAPLPDRLAECTFWNPSGSDRRDPNTLAPNGIKLGRLRYARQGLVRVPESNTKYGGQGGITGADRLPVIGPSISES